MVRAHFSGTFCSPSPILELRAHTLPHLRSHAVPPQPPSSRTSSASTCCQPHCLTGWYKPVFPWHPGCVLLSRASPLCEPCWRDCDNCEHQPSYLLLQSMRCLQSSVLPGQGRLLQMCAAHGAPSWAFFELESVGSRLSTAL